MWRQTLYIVAAGLVLALLAVPQIDARTGEPGPPEDVPGWAHGRDAENTGDAVLDEGENQEPRIVPPTTRIRVGHTRQFRLVNARDLDGNIVWRIRKYQVIGEEEVVIQWNENNDGENGPKIGTIDQDGRFTALAPGWVIIEVVVREVDENNAPDNENNATQDVNGDPENEDKVRFVAQTDTIWTFDVPMRVGPQGGKAFDGDDPRAGVHFPPQASARALMVHVRKRAENELPAQARGRGVISAFEFLALDEETGEDVGGRGFDREVTMVLSWDNLPPGVQEKDLQVGTFDEDKGKWVLVMPNKVVSVDPDEKTITIQVGHFSLWAVLAGSDIPTSAQSTSWGAVKKDVHNQ